MCDFNNVCYVSIFATRCVSRSYSLIIESFLIKRLSFIPAWFSVAGVLNHWLDPS